MQTNLAQKNEEVQPWLEYGTVLQEQKDRFIVRAKDGEFSCMQAVGCVVRPQAGDRVLLSLDRDGGAYVLSILSREAAQQGTELEFSGDVTLRVRQGNLHLAAEQTVVCAGERFEVYAESGEIAVSKLSFLGRVMQWQAQKLLSIAESVEHVFGSLTQRLRESQRYVEEHEDVQCGSARHLVEETLTMQAKNINHMAEELVKVDGEQVHLG